MPKTERILANLPPTFRVRSEPSALRALAEAYGSELQLAENALAAVVRAHWVDHADVGEPLITDLARIGALYGLAPRGDETVEEFREHLKRYVRTFLDGTVTVRGVLRIAAESLHLHIEDEALDPWWMRDDDLLVTESPRGADAAEMLLGVAEAAGVGHGPLPAVLDGDVDLRDGVDLRGRSELRIALDGGGPITVDLAAGAADPAAVQPLEISAAINQTLGLDDFATVHEGRLRLASASTGPDAEIRVAASDEDAAGAVLGLPPRTFAGADATPATVTGTVDLSNPVDLTATRFLRIALDGTHLQEVDCAAAAADPTSVDIDDVATAVNDAFGFEVATHDGRFLTLTSPTSGASGHVAFLAPAAQSATSAVMGRVAPFTFGEDERKASVVGQDVGFDVDLSSRSRLRLTVDSEPTTTVDLAGADPVHTTPAEMTVAINEAIQMSVASHDGRRLTLASPSAGAAGRLVVEEVTNDAAEPVLGLRPRIARGALPLTASIAGTVNLSAGLDLAARYVVVVSVDGASAVEVDLRRGVADLRAATLDELVDATNAALGGEVARHDGAHLILVSPTAGEGGSVVVAPATTVRHRRFLTRARVSDDAATTLFGFTARRATGTAATAARVDGANDLVAGVDLREHEWLRLQVDGEVRDVRVTGPRSRATTPAEIVGQVNDAFAAVVATTDGHTVSVLSPTAGTESRVEVQPPRSRDAIDVLGLEPGLTRGTAATGVRFTGTVDLGAGVTLPAAAALRIGVDGGPPVDIAVGADADPVQRSLSQLVAAINQALVATVAAHDGSHLILSSPQTGTDAGIEIGVPTTGTDVSVDVLGVSAPRHYRGNAATAALVTGTTDLSAIPAGLTANLLRVAVDGGPPVTVDVTSRAADPAQVSAEDIATAINAETDARAAVVTAVEGSVLSIESPTVGLSSRLDLQRTGASDAAPLIFGRTGIVAAGRAPTPAVLDGLVDLRAPVDLSTESTVRLVLDDEPPFDVDVAGGRPAATLLAEVVATLNSARPGIAEATPEDRLRVRSSTAGATSVVEVRPQRHLEVQEYPPAPAVTSAQVQHGGTVPIHNSGAAPSTATVEIGTDLGVAGARLADAAAGWSVRVLEPLSSGQRLTLSVSATGQVAAWVHAGADDGTQVPADRVQVEPPDGRGVLVVQRGRNTWSFSECIGARYDSGAFDRAGFAGGTCREQGIFDLSRFEGPSGSPAVYAGLREPATSTATVSVCWERHVPGAFLVNLPDRLDPRFGMRLGEARFGSREPESHQGLVTEPDDSADYIERRINLSSRLVEAERVPAVPIGWSAVALPFRDPAALSLGRADQEARLYLTEEGLHGDFIEIRAAEAGAWGNGITLTGRASGPAIFDIEVHYAGTRFENARRAVAGPPLPALADHLLRPGPAGVLTAKAAGVHATVTRDRAATAASTHDLTGEGPVEEGSP